MRWAVFLLIVLVSLASATLLEVAGLAGTAFGVTALCLAALTMTVFLRHSLAIADHEYHHASDDRRAAIDKPPVPVWAWNRRNLLLAVTVLIGALLAGLPAVKLSRWWQPLAWSLVAILCVVSATRPVNRGTPPPRLRSRVRLGIAFTGLLMAALHFYLVYMIFILVFKNEAHGYVFARIGKLMALEQFHEGTAIFHYCVHGVLILCVLIALRKSWRSFAARIVFLMAAPTALAWSLTLFPVDKDSAFFTKYLSLMFLVVLWIVWAQFLWFVARNKDLRQIRGLLSRALLYSCLPEALVAIVCGIITYTVQQWAGPEEMSLNRVTQLGFSAGALICMVCLVSGGFSVYLDLKYGSLRMKAKTDHAMQKQDWNVASLEESGGDEAG